MTLLICWLDFQCYIVNYKYSKYSCIRKLISLFLYLMNDSPSSSTAHQDNRRLSRSDLPRHNSPACSLRASILCAVCRKRSFARSQFAPLQWAKLLPNWLYSSRVMVGSIIKKFFITINKDIKSFH